VREGRVEEKWIVTLPARLAVSLRMSSAEMQIDGVAGGTEVRAGHGSVRVDVPRGDLRIDLTVGDVKVHNASTSLGNVVLSSRVGSTRLWINGLRLQVPNPPGPGSRISAAGEGQETIRVGVEVGDISVKAGVADSSR
jgi:hypothetical protein